MMTEKTSMAYHRITALVWTALVWASALGLTACGDENNTPPFTGAVRAGNSITNTNGLNPSVSEIAAFSDIGLDTL